MLGEHTNELLQELGYSERDVAALQSSGLVADNDEILRIKEERRAQKEAAAGQ
jgi:hypothetical protein